MSAKKYRANLLLCCWCFNWWNKYNLFTRAVPAQV